jgi:16S rRNA (cytidine1402-2'-O)-methyltransferase
LRELGEVLPERQVVLARELTKKFEEFLRGKPADLLEVLEKRSLKGEFVVLVDNTQPGHNSRNPNIDGSVD